jgi:hypothetical protein
MELDMKKRERVGVTRCSSVMAVFSQHWQGAGPVGILQSRETCTVEPATCHAVHDMGVLRVGERVYMVSMNTT